MTTEQHLGLPRQIVLLDNRLGFAVFTGCLALIDVISGLFFSYCGDTIYFPRCSQLSREQVRAMRARRDQERGRDIEREQKSENATCSTMPPPPPRSTHKPSTSAAEFHEDSQATRIDGGGAVVNGGNLRSEPSVNDKGGITESTQPETATAFTINETVTDQEPQVQVPSVSGSTMGQDLLGEESTRGQAGATSQLSLSFSQARSSSSRGQVQQAENHGTSETLPTGFFEDSKPGKIAENINSEFDAFMEEVSKLESKDVGGPSAEELEKVPSLEPEENRAIDYDDFEQL